MFSQQPSMLVLHDYKCHRYQKLQESWMEVNTDTVLISGGLPAVNQPCDGTLNKEMKSEARGSYHGRPENE